MVRKLKLRFRALFRPDDIGDEIELHIEQLADELVAEGLSPREARIAATRQFGNATRIREQSRELFSFGLLSDLWRDLSYAGRVFRRSPWFFAGAAFVLALGIGANCAIFNLVYSVLLKPLPYERPEQVVIIRDASTSGRIKLWRDRSTGMFSDMAVMKMWSGNPDAQFDLVLPDRADRLRAGLVTPNFFGVLGAHAVLGRVFSPRDEASGRDDLVVLSHGFWQRAFGGDPRIIGRPMTFISGLWERRPRVYTVIGVLHPDFRFTYPLETEVWAINPWRVVEATNPRFILFSGAVARLVPGISAGTVNARMADPFRKDLRFTKVQPVTEWVAGETRSSILLVAGVALLLLVIACATVANALLVRLAERRRELAVRASLGAGRARLIRQLLTEGLALSLAGSAGGVLLAAGLIPILRSLVPAAVPRGDEMALSPGLLLFPAGAATLVTLLALVAPALQGSRLDIAQVLKNSAGSVSAVRWRFAFVALQSAVAAGLLVGAALLLISFWRLQHVELGFDGKQVLTAEMRLLGPEYYASGRGARFQQEVAERVRALPGVLEAGVTSAVPFRGIDWFQGVVAIGPAGEEKVHVVNIREVDPAFFSVMRLKLLRGRLLTDRDTASSESVAVISESLARLTFPVGDPVGKRLAWEDTVREIRILRTVVGIIKDVRYQGLDQVPAPAAYVPRTQRPTELVCLVLRTAGKNVVTPAMLRRVIHEIDPTVPVMDITTIDKIVSESVAGRRFYTTTVAAFAALALLLTATGLIVVIARSVAERRRELAIRSALGAQKRELTRLVMRQGLMPVILGTAVGLLGAWFGARMVEQFLFGVTLHQPAVYAGAGVFTVAVAAGACYLPARRVGEEPPAAVLQGE
jgi:predicted permease